MILVDIIRATNLRIQDIRFVDPLQNVVIACCSFRETEKKQRKYAWTMHDKRNGMGEMHRKCIAISKTAPMPVMKHNGSYSIDLLGQRRRGSVANGSKATNLFAIARSASLVGDGA